MKPNGWRIGLCLMVLSATLCAQESIEQLRARADKANPRDCVKVCFDLSRKLIESSNQQYAASNQEQGLKLMHEAISYARKGTQASIQTRKNQKHLEIVLREMAKRVHEIGQSLALDDRPPVMQDQKELEQMRDDMLTSIFGVPKKSLEEKR